MGGIVKMLNGALFNVVSVSYWPKGGNALQWEGIGQVWQIETVSISASFACATYRLHCIIALC